MSPDIQAALAAALLRAQQQQAPAPHPHQMIPQAQGLAQALAHAIANGRLPLGKARVAPGGRTDVGGQLLNPNYHPGASPIDGGYNGDGQYQNGTLIGRQGFGPHPVPPMILPPGMRSTLGQNYAS